MTKYTLEHYIGNHTKKEGDCLVYTLKTNSWGYARVSQYSPVRKIYGEQLLHRAVWTAQFGIIPKGLIIMHLCDNPACLNIEHLKLGTVQENNKDRDVKGRNRAKQGVENGTAKLNDDKVRFIRQLKGEFSGYFIAPFFGVSPADINSIWREATWRHVI